MQSALRFEETGRVREDAGLWRPRLPKNLRELIRGMAHDNPTWGGERIANELKLSLAFVSHPGQLASTWQESVQAAVPISVGLRSFLKWQRLLTARVSQGFGFHEKTGLCQIYFTQFSLRNPVGEFRACSFLCISVGNVNT